MTPRLAIGLLLACALLASCAVDEAPPTLQVDARQVEVESPSSLVEVVVFDADGLVLARRAGGEGVRRVSLRHGAPPRAPLRVEVQDERGRVVLAGRVPGEASALLVDVDVPAGQGLVPLGDEHAFAAVEGARIQAGFVITLAQPGTVELMVGAVRERIETTVPGERRTLFVPVTTAGPSAVEVAGDAGTLRSALVPQVLGEAQARQQLALVGLVFPADASGQPEAARPPGRVSLPAPWWRRLLVATGLTWRARDPHGPWSFQSVQLRNDGEQATNLVVRSRVLTAAGEPAPAFRPRMRDRSGDTGVVSALLRVPAGATSSAQLPLFVDPGALPEGATTWTQEITVTPLGSDRPLWTDVSPLQVRRGSTWISLAFGLSLLAGFLGSGLIVLRLRAWLTGFRTADLVTIAVFATLAFLVSGASAVVSAAVGSLLGPFQIFVTNLADDVLRYALLATLVTLLPRPGVAGLTVLLTWLMRGVALGAFSPVDLVYVGSSVLWLEGGLWAVGVTRGAAWVDGAPLLRWLRLGAAFGLASVLTSMTGLVVAMVLYRLFYADWYVVAVLAGPGFLYVWIACWLGTGFASSLRRVAD